MERVGIVRILRECAREDRAGTLEVSREVRADALPATLRDTFVVERPRACPFRAQQVLEARDARRIAIRPVACSRRAEVGPVVERGRGRQERKVAMLRNLREEIAVLAYRQRWIEAATKLAHPRADQRGLPVEQRPVVHQRAIERPAEYL